VRVLIDTTYSLRAPRSGTAVYTRMLCDELSRRDDIELVQVANRRRRPPAGGGLPSVRNLVGDQWWLAVELPRLATHARAEVIHHPLPARSMRTRIPQVCTVHDLSFERLPECFDRRFRLYARLAHRGAARASAAVICVSETTANDVGELWGVAPERIVVARHGPGQASAHGDSEGASAAGGPAPRHFLYVGDDEPRKNLPTLLEAYRVYRERAEHPLPLILAGLAGARAPGVELEPSPPPERLFELYRGAAALIQPSLYEGFGLTVLEAMSAGTPVLAARSPGLLEVCDHAVRLADPHDAGAFAEAMLALGSEAGLRRDLAERGRAWAPRFSWSACADAHLTAYSLALSRKERTSWRA
jgi:glycosyltransferase involved in cell wall biosynthesis